jgi:hypothetical protein
MAMYMDYGSKTINWIFLLVLILEPYAPQDAPAITQNDDKTFGKSYFNIKKALVQST